MGSLPRCDAITSANLLTHHFTSTRRVFFSLLFVNSAWHRLQRKSRARQPFHYLVCFCVPELHSVLDSTCSLCVLTCTLRYDHHRSQSQISGWDLCRHTRTPCWFYSNGPSMGHPKPSRRVAGLTPSAVHS